MHKTEKKLADTFNDALAWIRKIPTHLSHESAPAIQNTARFIDEFQARTRVQNQQVVSKINHSWWWRAEKTAAAETPAFLTGLVRGIFDTNGLAQAVVQGGEVFRGEKNITSLVSLKNRQLIGGIALLESMVEGGREVIHAGSSISKDSSPENFGKQVIRFSGGAFAVVGGVAGLKGVKGAVRKNIPNEQMKTSSQGNAPKVSTPPNIPEEGVYRTAAPITTAKIAIIPVHATPWWKIWSNHSHEAHLNGQLIPLNLKVGPVIELNSNHYFFDGKNLIPANIQGPPFIKTSEGYFLRDQRYNNYYTWLNETSSLYFKDIPQLSNWILLEGFIPSSSTPHTLVRQTFLHKKGSGRLLLIKGESSSLNRFHHLEEGFFYDVKREKTFSIEGAGESPITTRVIEANGQYYLIKEPYIQIDKTGNIRPLSEIPVANEMQATDLIFVNDTPFVVGELLAQRGKIFIGKERYLSSFTENHPVIVAQYLNSIPAGNISSHYQTFGYLADNQLVWALKENGKGYISKSGKLLDLNALPPEVNVIGEKWADIRSGQLLQVEKIDSRNAIRLANSESYPNHPIKSLDSPTDFLGREIKMTINGQPGKYRILGIELSGKEVYVSSESSGKWVSRDRILLSEDKTTLFNNDQ